MTTTNRRITTGLCTLVMGAALALGAGTVAEAAPATTAPAQITPAPQDPTPLVVQARDYPVGIVVTTASGTGGFQEVVQPGEHFVLGTKSGSASSIRFAFNGAAPDQAYEVNPDRVMRFDMQGNAQAPAVTLRMS